MLFRKKYQRGMEYMREKNRAKGETDEDYKDKLEKGLETEKHDFFSMVFSAYAVLLPVALGVMLLIVGIAYLIFFL